MLIEMVEEWKENLEKNFIIGAVLTDLSKAFDCIPHDLLIAKLSAYSLNDDLLCHIYSYFKDCKQCAQITNERIEFDTIMSGHLSWIFGSILFLFFFNGIFFLIPKASVHNFTNDNTLAKFESKLEEFFQFWNQNVKQKLIGFNIHNDKMIVNPEKFQLTKVALITLRLKSK